MRKTLRYTVKDEGRDHGKVFVITEMSPMRSEKWAFRALAALARSGVEVPDDVQKLGMAGIAALGFQALSGVSFADAEPLLDEMLECLQVMPDPARPEVVRHVIEDDIEEIATLVKLRREVFELHTGFFERAGKSKSI